MTVSLWQDTASWPGELPHDTLTADIVVVGGGIVGATLATLLGQAGREVLVLEAGTVGGGASGRNAGHCIVGQRNEYHQLIERIGHDAAKALRTRLEENRTLVRGFCDQLGVPYEARGSQYFAINDDDVARVIASAEALQRDGFDVFTEPCDPAERGFHTVIRQPGDMELQPYVLVTRLMAASGARVEENCAVRTIEGLPNGGVRLRANRLTVEACQVILATNGYSRQLHPFFRDRVMPTRGQIFVTEPLPGGQRLLDRPTGSTEDGRYFYFRQLFDGRLLIGGNRHPYRDEEQTYGDEVNLPLQEHMREWVVSHFPEFADLQVTHRWAGIMGYSVDGLPQIGTLPDLPNVAFAVGFTGHGMGYGPITAQMTVEYLLEGRHPGPFHVERLLA